MFGVSWSEFKKFQLTFLKVFAPYTYLLMVETVVAVTGTYYSGTIDEVYLAGIGLGHTMYAVFMLAPMYGYATVFESYAPQIVGSGRMERLGTLVMKVLLQGFLLFLVVVGPLVNLIYVLRFMDVKDKDGGRAVSSDGETVESIATSYLRYMSFYGYVDFVADLLNRYLINQKHEIPIYSLSTMFVAISITLNHVFVRVLGLKVLGICLAVYFSRLPVLIINVCYCTYNIWKGKLGWEGFTMEVFRGWPEMLKLGVSGTATAVAEVGLFEAAVFVSNFAGIVTMSTVLITIQVDLIVFGIKLGMTYASAIMIGNALGEGLKAKVKASIFVSVFNCIASGIPLSILVYIFRVPIAKMFTSDADTIEMYDASAWIILLNNPLDSIATVVSRGALTAMGKQRFNAITLSIVSYVIILPFMVVVTFYTDLKAKGILAAILAYSLIFGLALVVRLRWINLDDEITATKVRLARKGDREVAVVYRNKTVSNKREGEESDHDGGRESDERKGDEEVSRQVERNQDGKNNEVRKEGEVNGNTFTDIELEERSPAPKANEKAEDPVPLRNIALVYVGAFLWVIVLTLTSFIDNFK